MKKICLDNELKRILEVLGAASLPLSVNQIGDELKPQPSRRTLQRRLAKLVNASSIISEGSGAGTRYRPRSAFEGSYRGLVQVGSDSIVPLGPEGAVDLVKGLLQSECHYAALNPSSLTISRDLHTADGGVDAEVDASDSTKTPSDCIFGGGITGFQIKAGTSFKPWQKKAISKELLDSAGALKPETKRLFLCAGHYTIIATGHDLTPQQRNQCKDFIREIISDCGFLNYKGVIDVLGAAQIAEFASRYPGIAASLTFDAFHEGVPWDIWRRDEHMSTVFQENEEQISVITDIRQRLLGNATHIRIVGEPGLGKTRVALEALSDPVLSRFVLYFRDGALFGNTKLFKQIIKVAPDKPLILVIDDLSQRALQDIWGSLKPLCGTLKIISLDHGANDAYGDETEMIHAPRLPDQAVKKILVSKVGDLIELDRWVAICEGSPRVAHAVGENLRANPEDLLKPPSTVPLWERFLHGHGDRSEQVISQINCVAQHLSLFSKFGYESPVAEEGSYIYGLVREVEPSISVTRFYEIIKELRDRRVLQGSRTLFFVPKALHIYLWKEFWKNYGRRFNFANTLNSMPESLHVWFMSMFKYADGGAVQSIIEDILGHNGIYSSNAMLTSDKGAQFLSELAEANPKAVLALLERTIGHWSDDELNDFQGGRQKIVWALEKIAVWSKYFTRAAKLLVLLARNENASNSNNATGTLLCLFIIGPERAVTESSPADRLPIVVSLLQSSDKKDRELGLSIMDKALATHGLGWRTVGPEFQGLKERAKLWRPDTYEDWRDAYFRYFDALVVHTSRWPDAEQARLCSVLLKASGEQLLIKPCTELAFEVLSKLIVAPEMTASELNHFFCHWQEYRAGKEHSAIDKRLHSLHRQYVLKSLGSRFQRYVLDVDYIEWDEDYREQSGKPKTRAKQLVKALVGRITRKPSLIDEIESLFAPEKDSAALWFFGQQLGLVDGESVFLERLTKVALSTKHQVVLHGYLSGVNKVSPDVASAALLGFLSDPRAAWLGVAIALRLDYDEQLFNRCLDVLEEGWIGGCDFSMLQYGRGLQQIPTTQLVRLLNLVRAEGAPTTWALLIGLLDEVTAEQAAEIDQNLIFEVISMAITEESHGGTMRGFHWHRLCQKFLKWHPDHGIDLLEKILTAMFGDYSLSYNDDVVKVANSIVESNPASAWLLIASRLEAVLPKWDSSILHWLKGGISREDQVSGEVVSNLPKQEILNWIDLDAKARAPLMAHAVPPSLDGKCGGSLTRELIQRFSGIDGVSSGISAAFHSGSWSGLTSVYLKGKRNMLRSWLAKGYQLEVQAWIESEIDYIDKQIEHEEMLEERSYFA